MSLGFELIDTRAVQVDGEEEELLVRIMVFIPKQKGAAAAVPREIGGGGEADYHLVLTSDTSLFFFCVQDQDISESKKVLQGMRLSRPGTGRGWGYQIAFLSLANGFFFPLYSLIKIVRSWPLSEPNRCSGVGGHRLVR